MHLLINAIKKSRWILSQRNWMLSIIIIIRGSFDQHFSLFISVRFSFFHLLAPLPKFYALSVCLWLSVTIAFSETECECAFYGHILRIRRQFQYRRRTLTQRCCVLAPGTDIFTTGFWLNPVPTSFFLCFAKVSFAFGDKELYFRWRFRFLMNFNRRQGNQNHHSCFGVKILQDGFSRIVSLSCE